MRQRDQARKEILEQVDTCDESHYGDKLVNLIMGYVWGKDSSPPEPIIDALHKLHYVVELGMERIRRETKHEERDRGGQYYWTNWNDKLFGPYDTRAEAESDAEAFREGPARIMVKLSLDEQIKEKALNAEHRRALKSMEDKNG